MQDEKPIKLLIDQLLKDYNLSDKMMEQKVVKNWATIVGQMIAQHTSKVQINQNELVVFVNSAVLKSELNYHRTTIIGKVNSYLGKELIKKISIR